MADEITAATSGRAKCRACGRAIAKGELRFGERLPSAFNEGETTYWFHLPCAAGKRAEKVLPVLEAMADPAGEMAAWRELAQRSVQHPRLARLVRAERTPSGRARCRHCRETIDKGGFRLALDWWEEGRFTAAGFIHVACAAPYFGSVEDLPRRLQLFDPGLSEDDLRAIEAGLVG
jgi:hypothetical protein